MNNGINWKQTLLTAFITVVVTVIAGMFLFYFQTKNTKLTYEIKQVSPFQKQNEKLTIYHISINNEGEEIAKKVKAIIDIYPAKIENYSFNNEFPIQLNDTLKQGKLYFETETINSEENISLSILASSNSKFPENPDIKIRSIGSSAILKENKSELGLKTKDSSIYIIAFLGLFASIVSSFIFGKSKNILSFLDKGKHIGINQKEVFAYLLDIEGLDELANKYREISYNISYWSASDRLTFSTLKENDEHTIKIISVLNNTLEYSGMIASESKAIIHYNISKLYQKVGNSEEEETHMSKAIKLEKLLINKRINLES